MANIYPETKKELNKQEKAWLNLSKKPSKKLQKRLQKIKKAKKQRLNTFRKELRKNPTIAENKVKGHLANLRIRHSFQKIRGPFIVDLWLKDYPLIIEVDGSHHLYSPEQVDYDKRRTEYLENNYKVKVLRINNSDAKSVPFLRKFLEPYIYDSRENLDNRS